MIMTKTKPTGCSIPCSYSHYILVLFANDFDKTLYIKPAAYQQPFLQIVLLCHLLILLTYLLCIHKMDTSVPKKSQRKHPNQKEYTKEYRYTYCIYNI